MEGQVSVNVAGLRDRNLSSMLRAISIATFLELFSITAFAAALSPIATALHASFASVRLLTIGYSVAVTIMLPVSGWVADALGARRTFMTAAALFCLGCLISYLSASMAGLVFGRVVQGLGCAFLVPVGRISLSRAYSGDTLLRILGAIAVPAVVGSTFGPLLGGLVVDTLGWRALFLVMLFAGAVCLVVAWNGYHDESSRVRKPFDFLSYFALSIAITSGLALLSQIRGTSLSSMQTNLLVALFVVAGGVFTIRVLRGRQYLLDFSLFSLVSFRAAAGAGNFSRLGISGVPLLFAYGLQNGLAFSAVAVGALLSLQALGALSCKRFAVSIIQNVGYGRTLTLNTVVLGASIVLLGFAFESRAITWIVPGVLLYGMTSSLQFSCLNTLVFRDLSKESKSAGASLSGTLMQLAVSLGIAIAFAMAAVFQTGSDALSMVPAVSLTLKVLGLVVLTSALNFRRLR